MGIAEPHFIIGFIMLKAYRNPKIQKGVPRTCRTSFHLDCIVHQQQEDLAFRANFADETFPSLPYIICLRPSSLTDRPNFLHGDPFNRNGPQDSPSALKTARL